jgi:hypothetical protein
MNWIAMAAVATRWENLMASPLVVNHAGDFVAPVVECFDGATAGPLAQLG